MAKSSDKSPPHLHARPRLPVYPLGDWTSSTCETRPLGTFLMRRMKFTDHHTDSIQFNSSINIREMIIILLHLKIKDWIVSTVLVSECRLVLQLSRRFSIITLMPRAVEPQWRCWLAVITPPALILIAFKEQPISISTSHQFPLPSTTNQQPTISMGLRYFNWNTQTITSFHI